MAKEEGKEKAAGIVAEACEAYGIAEKFVLASKIDKTTGVATIVTHGGKKVRYSAGDKVEKLDPISVSGINPAPKRKPITGSEKK